LPTNWIESLAAKERRVLERQERDYRSGRPQPELAGCVVILVDDGLATGATMYAAVRSARAQHAARVVVAVPVAPPETCDALRREADAVVCLVTPAHFRAVSAWYDDFSATTDDQVRRLLESPRSA
jgi:putative phosphoribosyl transferase